MATARTNKITPPAIDNAPTVKWRKARSSSPRAMSTRATVAAVTSILRTTSRLAAASSGAVISRNGTSASLGPMPISSTKKVSITPAAVIDVCAIHQVCRKPGSALILACQVLERPRACAPPGYASKPGLPRARRGAGAIGVCGRDGSVGDVGARPRRGRSVGPGPSSSRWPPGSSSWRSTAR